ncbi:DUF881 domain-containing protein, partial [Klebsiella pneumoniae]|uniref:DUF881 domain-containing protein n=1 Tax=Klebsiella pneumoniae TaxID=573 RepID=UPI0035325CA2
GVGTVAVTGPGVVVTVDDAPGSQTDARDRVLDLDLQILVNGLWQSGAEAISVNGHRLSNLTAIRGAGEAITVDYRSLTRPYVIEAIGDRSRLRGAMTESPEVTTYTQYAQKYGLGLDQREVDVVKAPAHGGSVSMSHATVVD